ncbi:MAG: TRAP transporter small permease [Planctomycetes bacterium]|nr:TRAP transporter small permease [Planctomycetota bacterium]
MKAFLSKAERVSEWVVGLGVFAMVISMALQILFRYFLLYPLAWTDTMARFTFVWSVFFAAFIGARKNMHVAIDMLPKRFPPFLRLASTLLINGLIIMILIVCAYYGFKLTYISQTSLLPAIPVPLGYIYLPFAISSMLTIASIVDISRDAIVSAASEKEK